MNDFRTRDDPVVKALNEGENRYRQIVLGQGPLPGYPIVTKEDEDDSEHYFNATARLSRENAELRAALLAARRGEEALRAELEWIANELPREGLHAGGEGYLAFANRLKARALAAAHGDDTTVGGARA